MLLVSAYPNGIPRMAEITLDQRVLIFTTAVAALTGLLFGLVPMAHVARGRVGSALKDSAGRTTAGTVRARLRSALVVVEVALAVLLVVGAGLLIRSFANLMRVDLGFNRAQMTTFGVVLPAPTYDAARRLDVYQRLAASLRALPGSRSVAAMTGLPPFRQVNANDSDFEHIPDTPGPPTGEFPAQNIDYYQYVSVGYTETMGIPVVSGRAFEERDTSGPPVVLVNETLVKRFFPNRDPIGMRVKPGFSAQLPWFTIVGVLKDVKQGGISAETGTELYMLTDQAPRTLNFAPAGMNFVVRSDRSLSALAPELRRAVAEIDPALPLIRMRTMEDVVGDSIARPRFLTTLLGIFAAVALALAAVGTYGILAYLVTERRQEIGIRMALGADRGMILRLVLLRGLLLSGLGLAIGLAASLGLSRVLGTLLFNVPPNDPATLALVAGVIAVVGAAACLVPAWRATRTDPLIALRAE
jgi:predicted permease